MLWLKAVHVMFMVTWFAGLFYLPRLFVYHADCQDEAGNARFKVMERKLYAIMTMGAVVTLVFGVWLWLAYWWPSTAGWLMTKLVLVALLIAYHFYCGHLVKVFRDDANRRSHVFYRWFNEFPALILIAVVILATVKPF